ncbi:MAG: hypothetical protein A2268_02105 [Candidatus Raymondbacteria bacterium RifOxyA12_full_50_37]|uniref:Delta-aminolevulinic acid dehydratase n=1 Tax=Candidatus Raymondbacteria bacterium RIFOXYD12_FULL_49_13 TaxID=1817890 RepID=A0A1F7F4K3_UNCRA|nr:MAG: hypothetical protein A2268_02105 [Candidatus Raymondbacteria bacterium RifOxyA12_full_50_37]OGJ91298.1 MAG: hypothetical protein A2350_13230 [Candidatus Raymondbacteria bacterium RifOxyB12_full_50_8]OGJ92221.1 MAG: hypothetical protein A2248_10935 [Candidatus Raymondbacteria bacterium RIFOXYA2_FULL_49_16]OGJ98547.1 MAG: hypothetical protein A2453_06735 [Candidatus Raymondbacteria bacterium RIFOXYC2_FULL_50_21]OGK00022.1 MAG: hypothetical protein A2487_09475 [Candidatus Raymondbacteria b
MIHNYLGITADTLASAKCCNYAGYDKFDALNSPLLERLSLGNAWIRFFITQAVCRVPINVRPLLLVKASRNPKGIALFSRAYLWLYQKTGDTSYLEESTTLLKWLNTHRCIGYQRACWGYNHIWQSIPPFVQFPGTPNLVTTVFAGESFLHGYRVSGRLEFLDAAHESALFITQDLPVLADACDERAIGYILGPQSHIVLNVQVLAGAFLVKVWKHTHEKELLDTAVKLLTFTVNRRTSFDSWDYSFPAEKYHGVDNYHTGGIVDGLLEYFEETGDDRFLDIYWKAVDYYRKALFESNGAPRWMNNQKYPHDVHGAAQGIISFVKAAKHKPEYLSLAHTIADWSIANLYRPKTRDFMYRQGRFLNWNFSLMRWCNAWMARALAELINDGQ